MQVGVGVVGVHVGQYAALFLLNCAGTRLHPLQDLSLAL